MTIRVPDDLADLRNLARELGSAPAFVIHEPAPDEDWDGFELPILHVELNPDHGYIELRTAVPAAGRAPKGALSFADVLSKLEHLAASSESYDVFWVSSRRPLALETDPDLSRYSARLALPLRSVMASEDPVGVAFLAQTDSVPGHRTA